MGGKIKLLEYTEKRGPAGRPAKLWRLTPAADRFFPDAHGDLALGIIAGVREAFGQEGYMAEVILEASGSYLFTEHHCPICSAAAACTGLCAAEHEVFDSVLGQEYAVERIEHKLSGGTRCVYRVNRAEFFSTLLSRRDMCAQKPGATSDRDDRVSH